MKINKSYLLMKDKEGKKSEIKVDSIERKYHDEFEMDVLHIVLSDESSDDKLYVYREDQTDEHNDITYRVHESMGETEEIQFGDDKVIVGRPVENIFLIDFLNKEIECHNLDSNEPFPDEGEYEDEDFDDGYYSRML